MTIVAGQRMFEGIAAGPRTGFDRTPPTGRLTVIYLGKCVSGKRSITEASAGRYRREPSVSRRCVDETWTRYLSSEGFFSAWKHGGGRAAAVGRAGSSAKPTLPIVTERTDLTHRQPRPGTAFGGEAGFLGDGIPVVVHEG